MNASQLIPNIKIAIENNFNVLIKGKPGVGKSDILTQATESLNYELMICHPVVDDPCDYKGLPTKIGDNLADFIPYGNLLKMINAKNPLVVFFDDLGQAPQSVQAACMQLLLAREINGKKISKHVRFVAATNSRKDNAGVNGLITPLLSRFHLIVEMEAKADDWKIWAINNKMPIELISFVNFRPYLLEGKMINTSGVTIDVPVTKEIENFACPRTIANLGKWIKAGVEDINIWAGCVGTAFATEFMGFYNIYKQLGSLPDKVINNPANAPIPDKPDIMYALMGALSHKATEVNFEAIIQYITRKDFPTEFSVFFIKDSTTRKPNLAETDAFILWSSQNKNYIK